MATRRTADSWKDQLNCLGYEQPARYAIVDSWHRCCELHLDRTATPRFRKIDDAELRARQNQSATLIEVCEPLLKDLLQTLPGNSNVIYVADQDGIVLTSIGAADHIAAFALEPGYDWSEKQMGTNGAGTAIAARKPVAVVGEEHFLIAFGNCTCTAAPIYGFDRSIVGALDVSSTAADARSDRLTRVIATADAISWKLYRRWRRTGMQRRG